MITPEQRRKWEAELSPEERSIVEAGRYAKAAVLLAMVACLGWAMADGVGRQDVQQASAAHATSAQVREAGGAGVQPHARQESAARSN